jgi:DNA-binding transcriptional LysR family regulator
MAVDLLRRVNLAELRAFCVAVELGSLGRAARLLQISQPALSKRMRELERLAGTVLLVRSPRGVKPTSAGQRLYVETRPLLTEAERLESVLAELRTEHGHLRVAASHTIAEYLLPGPLAEYQARLGRRLALELVVANSTVVHDLVIEGRADFGIAACRAVGDHSPLVSQLDLCEDEVVIGVPSSHPWVALETIPLSEFLLTPMVMRDPSSNSRQIVDAVLREQGVSLAAPVAEVGSTSAAITAALSGRAPALLSRLAVGAGDRQMVSRRVDGLRFRRRFVVIWSAQDALGPEARALIDYLRNS